MAEPTDTERESAEILAGQFKALWKSQNELARLAPKLTQLEPDSADTSQVVEQLLERLKLQILHTAAINQLAGSVLMLLDREHVRLTGERIPGTHLWVEDGERT